MDTPNVATPPASTPSQVGLPPPPVVASLPVEDKALTNTWDRVIRGLLYALTFLLPLLFTSWTSEPLEFSKQILLYLLTTAALVAWLLKLLVSRNWRLVKTPLDLPIGALLLIYLLASIFSVDRVASFLGFYGSFSGNFFQVLFLILFYYLVVNNFQDREHLRRLVAVFSGSVAIALLYAILQFFGWFVVRLPFAKMGSFNTIGGLLTLALFAAFAVLLAVGLRSKNYYWFAWEFGRLWRILAVVIAFLILFTINFVYAWVGLLVGLLVYMVFQVGLAKTFNLRALVTPLVLLIVVIAFLVVQLVFPFLSVRNIVNFNLPLEVRLDYATAWPVLRGVVAHQPILGSGPNTFLYAFSKYREQNFNLTPFWNVRFDKAPSEAAEYLVGTGVVGFLAFEILSLVFLIYGVYFLFRKKDEENWGVALTLFAGFAMLWVAHWFFFFNTVIAFSYWLMLAGFVAASRVAGDEKVKSFDFSFATSPRRTVSVVTVVSLALVVVIVFVFFAAATYASDVFYRKGLLASADQKTLDAAQRDFEQAIRLNRFRPDYYLTYGEFLFLRINQELTKKNPNIGLVQQWLTASINTSRAAVNLSPTNWTAWERLANLYTSARPLVAGVDKYIIDSLTKATEQDPNNPILWTELGQVYRLAARKLDPAILGTGPDSDNDGLSDAQEVALGCDPKNPSTAGDGILDGAKVLAGLSCSAPGSLPDAVLQKYLKTDPEMLLKAEDAFKKAIALKDDYEAAYYQLALTYEQIGNLDQAISYMEQALQRFPTDVSLKFELGRMDFNAGKVDQAARQFQEILILMPQYANARFSLALSYERLGQPDLALAQYRKLLESNPNNQTLKDKIQQLETQKAPLPAPKTPARPGK